MSSAATPEGSAILVTGGLGFVGAAYVQCLFDREPSTRIVILDAHTYAADAGRLPERVRSSGRVAVVTCNLRSWSHVLKVLREHDIREIVHFAAQSHVTRSFEDPLEFTEDNVCGTQALLECARLHEPPVRRFVFISTDEVYGDSPLGAGAAAFGEDAAMRPTNPYAASKAGAELLAYAYHRCYNVPVIVTRGNNIYGPGQHPEKLIPRASARLAAGSRVPIEGDGQQLRCFLFVDDAVAAIETVRQLGAVGETYNIGGQAEHSVLEVVEVLGRLLRPTCPAAELVEFVPDRAYNDKRYLVDSQKLRALGWEPRRSLVEGLALVLQAQGCIA